MNIVGGKMSKLSSKFHWFLKLFNKDKIFNLYLANEKENYTSHGYYVQYMKNDSSEINLLCDRHGTDKGESNSKNRTPPRINGHHTLMQTSMN